MRELVLPKELSPAGLYQALAEVAGKRLGHRLVGTLWLMHTEFEYLPIPRRVAQHPFVDTALRWAPELWRERHEVAVVLGPQQLRIAKGIRTRVRLPATPEEGPDPVAGALVVHNHPRRRDYAGDLGPSVGDLDTLLFRRAAGLVLVSPGALWVVGFPEEGQELPERAVAPEERERLLAIAGLVGNRCLHSRRYDLLKHLAAMLLTLLGADWARFPARRLQRRLSTGALDQTLRDAARVGSELTRASEREEAA
jgi:hypothetical protein